MQVSSNVLLPLAHSTDSTATRRRRQPGVAHSPSPRSPYPVPLAPQIDPGNSASTPVAAALRMAALSLRHSQTALRAYYRKMAQRLGGDIAVFVTARKLATLIYRLLRWGQPRRRRRKGLRNSLSPAAHRTLSRHGQTTRLSAGSHKYLSTATKEFGQSPQGRFWNAPRMRLSLRFRGR